MHCLSDISGVRPLGFLLSLCPTLAGFHARTARSHLHFMSLITTVLDLRLLIFSSTHNSHPCFIPLHHYTYLTRAALLFGKSLQLKLLFRLPQHGRHSTPLSLPSARDPIPDLQLSFKGNTVSRSTCPDTRRRNTPRRKTPTSRNDVEQCTMRSAIPCQQRD